MRGDASEWTDMRTGYNRETAQTKRQQDKYRMATDRRYRCLPVNSHGDATFDWLIRQLGDIHRQDLWYNHVIVLGCLVIDTVNEMSKLKFDNLDDKR